MYPLMNVCVYCINCFYMNKEKFYINIVVVDQDDSGKSTDTGHLIDKLHGLGSFRPPSTTALSLLLLNILISSRTWLVVPPRMIVLFLSLTPPLVVSKLVSLRMDRPMSTLSLLHPWCQVNDFFSVTRWTSFSFFIAWCDHTLLIRY